MKKCLYGVVFTTSEDKEYGGMAYVWARDTEIAYWL
jgi:hypothetical protein